MEEMLEKYEQAFGEPYPMRLSMGMDEREIMDDIERCLKSGRPKRAKKGAIY